LQHFPRGIENDNTASLEALREMPARRSSCPAQIKDAFCVDDCWLQAVHQSVRSFSVHKIDIVEAGRSLIEAALHIMETECAGAFAHITMEHKALSPCLPDFLGMHIPRSDATVPG
jgi:hypothetical protein